MVIYKFIIIQVIWAVSEGQSAELWKRIIGIEYSCWCQDACHEVQLHVLLASIHTTDTMLTGQLIIIIENI